MVDTAFEEFAEAVAARRSQPAATDERQFEKVTVLGGGRDAQQLAALCLAGGTDVTLFSAYGAELDALKAAGGITIRGEGPVGTYQIDQDGIPSITTTAELDRAVRGAELIFLTGPVHKQRTYAMVLADHLHDGQVLVLAPGRSLGAAEAAWLLRVGGCTCDYTLVEVQGLPFWHEATGGTLHLSAAATAAAATLPSGRHECLAGLARLLPNIEPLQSTVHSSFRDGSGLVEVPAMLLGGPAVGSGGPEIPMGGVALEENLCFRSLIGERHTAVMQQMASERAEVARQFGVRDLPSLDGWLDSHAGAAGGAGRRPIPDAAQAAAIVRCATVGSLVPLLSAARISGTEALATEAMVTLASAVLGADVRTAGRRLEAIGIEAGEIEDARRILDDIAKGAR